MIVTLFFGVCVCVCVCVCKDGRHVFKTPKLTATGIFKDILSGGKEWKPLCIGLQLADEVYIA